MKILNLANGVYDFDCKTPFMVYNPERKICNIYGKAVGLNGEKYFHGFKDEITEILFIVLEMPVGVKHIHYNPDGGVLI